MSAIAGIYYLDGRFVDCSDMDPMMENIAHRGMDGGGVWRDASVSLGHRMLWTTPESLHEQLPFQHESGQYAITADARIDNRDQLIERLAISGRAPAQLTDSELILASYISWGEQCVEMLIGDFAFAIWDKRKQVLFCARDHFGVKPFYYHSSAKLFAFASEIKALLCLEDVPCRLNELKVAEYLTQLYGDKELTFHKDILRLPPAHCLSVSREGISLRCYWSLDPLRELRFNSDEEYAEALRELFTEAVRCRLRSAYPIGSMLSGGLDSSSVTCVARNLLAQEGRAPLHTFSAIFDKLVECDERPFINSVINQRPVNSHYLHPDEFSPLAYLDRILWHLDEVLSAGNINIQWGHYGIAKEIGVRVILDGWDGDTTISHGVGYLMELARSKRWAKLIREGKGYARHFNGLSPWKVVWLSIERHGLHPRVREGIKRVRRVTRAVTSRTQRMLNLYNQKPNSKPFIKADFIQSVDFDGHRLKLRKKAAHGQGYTERFDHYRRFNNPGVPTTLEMLNKSAGAFSVENRFPFWDKRLAEFCLALPAEQKLNGGWNRMVMRRAMNEILPKEVQWRGGKTSLGPHLTQGLKTFERARLDKLILRDSNLIQKYVDTAVLQEAYLRFVDGKESDVDMLEIWKSVSLALWLQYSHLGP